MNGNLMLISVKLPLNKYSERRRKNMREIRGKMIRPYAYITESDDNTATRNKIRYTEAVLEVLTDANLVIFNKKIEVFFVLIKISFFLKKIT